MSRLRSEECVILSELSSEHIMKCYGVLRHSDHVYFLFELLTGECIKITTVSFAINNFGSYIVPN